MLWHTKLKLFMQHKDDIPQRQYYIYAQPMWITLTNNNTCQGLGCSRCSLTWVHVSGTGRFERPVKSWSLVEVSLTPWGLWWVSTLMPSIQYSLLTKAPANGHTRESTGALVKGHPSRWVFSVTPFGTLLLRNRRIAKEIRCPLFGAL